MTTSSPAPTVAVLGTGIIGAPVAVNLAESFQVRVWNRTRAAADRLGGLEVFDTAAAAVAGADIVVTVLKDGPAVREVMESAVAGLAAGTVWIQLGTVGEQDIADLAEFARQHALTFYDAPVQGTKQPAEAGQLVVLAAGPLAERDTAAAVFEAIGSRTVWVDEAAGAATRLKLALNSLVFALTHGIAESLSLATALGVDPRLVAEVVTGGPLDSGFFQGKSGAMLAGNYATAFSVDNSVKDARLILAAAEKAGVAVDVTAAGLARFQRAAAAGHGAADMAASHLAGAGAAR
ncbi:NAD(P)-dependent oxidoreductase [Nocardia sp. NPDC050712]|uniref:NAD(P)-dependent oxidoreductase n=1 Tax=Nocardia sp. NPDC050712 TaxID=3155518 RepID=UPI00340A59B0